MKLSFYSFVIFVFGETHKELGFLFPYNKSIKGVYRLKMKKSPIRIFQYVSWGIFQVFLSQFCKEQSLLKDFIITICFIVWK